jgi:hypothetical protein
MDWMQSLFFNFRPAVYPISRGWAVQSSLGVKKTMRSVIGVVLYLLAGSIHAGNAHCSAPGVTFEIKDNQVSFFYATSSIAHPDLANGYTLTCVHHIGKFSKFKNGNEYVLAFSEENDQYGESRNCKVHIVETGPKFHIYTTECVSECMKFDQQLEMVGNTCHSVSKVTPNKPLEPTR